MATGYWGPKRNGFQQWIVGKPPKRGKKPRRPKPSAGVITVGKPATPGYVAPAPGALEGQAGVNADTQINREKAEIERQRQIAAQRALEAVKMISGLGAAQGEMLKGIPQQVLDMRTQAGKDIAGIGGAVSTGVADRLGAAQDEAGQFIQSQTGMEGGGHELDVDAARKALYATTGSIPGQEQIEIGAASGMAAAGMPAVAARATQQEVVTRMAQAAAEDGEFRDKLIAAVAKRPELYQDALSELYEIEKAKFGIYEANKRLKLDQQKLALETRAERANEKALGIKNQQANRTLKLRENELRLREKKYGLDVQKAEKAGRKIDAAASKVIGYVVDVNGDPVLNAEGKRIKVVQSAGDKAKQTRKDRMDAITEARSLRGKVVSADRDLHQGQYVARPGAKGVFPDGSTNDPSKALRRDGMSFPDAVTYIVQKYGVSRSVARSWVIASGWKPDGKRP